MESVKEAIMDTLFKIARKYEKAYCYPSQERLLGLLRKYHGVRISRRTICRRLGEMEHDGYFSRVRRHRRDSLGRMLFNSTLYKIGGRAFNWVHQQGARAAKFFSFYHVPKLAQYRATSARDLSLSGKAAALLDGFIHKGLATPAIRTA